MSLQDTTADSPAPAQSEEHWYRLPGEQVADRLGVDPAVGLSAQRAAKLLGDHGPNALPSEPPPSGWERFAGQYRTYMQLILVAARSSRWPCRSGARR